LKGSVRGNTAFTAVLDSLLCAVVTFCERFSDPILLCQRALSVRAVLDGAREPMGNAWHPVDLNLPALDGPAADAVCAVAHEP